MDKTDTIRVLKVEPEKLPRVVTLPNSLEALRIAVGGYMESVCLDQGVYLLCGDANQYTGSPDNGDPTAGPFFIVGEKGGMFCSLDEAAMVRYAARFTPPAEQGVGTMRMTL